jgi:hypothetical protein
MYKSIQQFQHIGNLLPYLVVTNIVQSNTSCCMCTCIVNLKAQVRLICSWCMKICLTRAARISTERLISVQPDELLRAKEKKQRSSIVYRSKERENYKLIYERERRNTPCRLVKSETKVEHQCRALLLSMGAGEADGGGQPPVSCPSPPASKTKEAPGPNT